MLKVVVLAIPLFHSCYVLHRTRLSKKSPVYARNAYNQNHTGLIIAQFVTFAFCKWTIIAVSFLKSSVSNVIPEVRVVFSMTSRISVVKQLCRAF